MKASASYRAVSGPSGPKPKRVKNESKKSLPGPPVPGVKKVKKSPKRVKMTLFDSSLTLFGLFLDFLGPWDRRARETLF